MLTLIVLESPAKCTKFSSYLGKDYIVMASYGHIFQLPEKSLGIDIENDFHPTYEISPSSLSVVKALKDAYKKCGKLILASDNDQEGIAIGYNVAQVLKVKNPQRMVFNEITKTAITEAIKKPIPVDMNKVYAQQARRLLDRLVGFQISPIVNSALNGNKLSAGRVQSVALRIIVDKENEISEASSNPYFKMNCNLYNEKVLLKTSLTEKNKAKHFKKKDEPYEIINKINKNTKFIVVDVVNKSSTRNPSPPFTTSTLQQEASTKLGFSVSTTMQIAQKLYEAGYITYMRTDSVILSDEALNQCKDYIVDNYGEKNYKYRQFKNKANAQAGHTATHPTDLKKTEYPNDSGYNKLYMLIWKRTVASQMASAEIDNQTISVDAINDTSILNKCLFQTTLQNIVFKGYLTVYNNMDEEELDKTIKINKKDELTFNNIVCSQEYEKPPLRYNEALLVKQMEKLGVGRPSTYASIINTIVNTRKYVVIKSIEGSSKDSLILELNNKYKLKETTKQIKIGGEKTKMIPTEVGMMVNEFLVKQFNEFVDYKFTMKMEEYLDNIAEGKETWYKILDKFQQRIVTHLAAIDKTKFIKNTSSDIMIGTNSKDQEMFKGTSANGDYVKVSDGKKWKYASIIKDEGFSLDTITVREAEELLQYPKIIGQIDKEDVIMKKWNSKYYCKIGTKSVDLIDIDPNDVTLDHIKELLKDKVKDVINEITIGKDKVVIREGKFGKYFQYKLKGKTANKAVPTYMDINKLDLAKVKEYLAKPAQKFVKNKSFKK
jgi:DNA topoisomerase-1